MIVVSNTSPLTNLAACFRALFAWLEDEGLCQRGPDAPTIVSQEEWLKAQQVAIKRLAAGEEV